MIESLTLRLTVLEMPKGKTNTYADVKAHIEREGYKLISSTYINNVTLLTLWCYVCKAEFQITYASFRDGGRCNLACRWKRMIENRGSKYNWDVINKYIDEQGGGDKLNSQVWINTEKKLDIWCHKCQGIYQMAFEVFRRGHRCGLCSKNKRFSYEYVRSYIENEKDYLLSSEYMNDDQKLEIQCGNCVRFFNVSFGGYKAGRRCQICFGNQYSEEEVADIIRQGGDHYAGGYVNTNTKFKVKCDMCDEIYETLLHRYLNGRRCRDCMIFIVGERQKLTFEDVQNYIKECGETLLSTEYINCRTPLKILCKMCNEPYERIWSTFKTQRARCDKCHDNRSKGEVKVESYLQSLDLDYDSEVMFDDCRNPLTSCMLAFDFVVEGPVRFIIEYNGEQHYKLVTIFGGEEEFQKVLKRDKIKIEYCEKNNIPLLIIPYWDFDKIEVRIDEFIQSLHAAKPQLPIKKVLKVPEVFKNKSS